MRLVSASALTGRITQQKQSLHSTISRAVIVWPNLFLAKNGGLSRNRRNSRPPIQTTLIGVDSEFGNESTLSDSIPSNGAPLLMLLTPRSLIFVVLDETRLFQPCNMRVVFEKETRYASLGKELILTDASQKQSFVRGGGHSTGLPCFHFLILKQPLQPQSEDQWNGFVRYAADLSNRNH